MSVFPKQPPRGGMAIPRPVNGETVPITPPGFVWSPAEGAGSYRLEIEDSDGREIYAGDGIADPVHLPDRELPPGMYKWDLIALTPDGQELGRRGKQSFVVPDGIPKLPWVDPKELLSRVPSGHPRLIFPRSELSRIRETLNTTRRRGWEQVQRAAESYVGLEPPPYPTYYLTEDPKRCRLEYVAYFRGFSRYVDAGLQTLALAYLMSGDRRYGESARTLLMSFAEWPVDDEDVTSVLAKWGDEPGLHLARVAHRAYDWIYDILNDAEREKVLAMCAGRARQALRRLRDRHDYLTNPGESHPARLVAYLSEMAIAMAGEAEDAAEWLDYSLKALMTFYPHWGGADGGWAEGIMYGRNYNTYYIGALEGLRGIGLDLWKRPLQRNVRKFFFYCTTPNAEMRPYGDGAERTNRNVALAEFMRYHACRFGDSACQWWADKLPLSGEPDPASDSLFDPLMALVVEESVTGKPPVDLPQAAVFRGVGWAALHSHLAEPERDAFLIFKSTPYGSVSHSHADQNSFCILKGGKALAIPSGYYGPAFGQPHHAEWTRQTKANNSILVNGEGQVVREARSRGRIVGFEQDREIAYVCGDATEAYGGKLKRFRRHVLFVHPALFVVLDDLEAPLPANFQWLLHGLEEMELDEDSGQVHLRREGARLDVCVGSPGGMSFSQTDLFETPFGAGVPEGLPEAIEKEMPNQWHFQAETAQPATATRIGAAMMVATENENLKWQTDRTESWIGASVEGQGWSSQVWAQLIPGAPGPEGFDETVSNGAAIIAGRWRSESGTEQVFVQGL